MLTTQIIFKIVCIEEIRNIPKFFIHLVFLLSDHKSFFNLNNSCSSKSYVYSSIHPYTHTIHNAANNFRNSNTH